MNDNSTDVQIDGDRSAHHAEQVLARIEDLVAPTRVLSNARENGRAKPHRARGAAAAGELRRTLARLVPRPGTPTRPGTRVRGRHILDVGGQRFAVDADALLLLHGDGDDDPAPLGMLSLLFDGSYEAQRRADGSIFIDYDSEHFDAVLQFAQTGVAPDAAKLRRHRDGLQRQTTFWGLDRLGDLVATGRRVSASQFFKRPRVDLDAHDRGMSAEAMGAVLDALIEDAWDWIRAAEDVLAARTARHTVLLDRLRRVNVVDVVSARTASGTVMSISRAAVRASDSLLERIVFDHPDANGVCHFPGGFADESIAFLLRVVRRSDEDTYGMPDQVYDDMRKLAALYHMKGLEFATDYVWDNFLANSRIEVSAHGNQARIPEQLQQQTLADSSRLVAVYGATRVTQSRATWLFGYKTAPGRDVLVGLSRVLRSSGRVVDTFLFSLLHGRPHGVAARPQDANALPLPPDTLLRLVLDHSRLYIGCAEQDVVLAFDNIQRDNKHAVVFTALIPSGVTIQCARN